MSVSRAVPGPAPAVSQVPLRRRDVPSARSCNCSSSSCSSRSIPPRATRARLLTWWTGARVRMTGMHTT